MEVDPAILPPDYVSLAQLQDRWLRQREKETSEKAKEERECELNVDHERRLPPAQPQDRRIENQEGGEEPIEEKEAGEKPIEEEGQSGLNENLRLPPDYVSLAQLREQWLEKKQREKEKEARENYERGLLKIDRCDKKASYEDKGKWKEIPIEGSEKGVGIYKEKLKIEADNGGIKGVLSGENSEDGGLKRGIGNVRDFTRGSGCSSYSSERGNNYRGRFKGLKGTQVHKMESKNGCNSSWVEKRRNGNIGDKEGSYGLKETELEKKSDNVRLEVCAGIDLRRGRKNDGDDHKSVKLGESGYNKNRLNRRNDNKEGSYRLKEPELEKKSDSEKSEVCSEKDVVSDRKTCGDAHVVESEGLNGKKVDIEMVLAVKIDENGCNKNGRKGFGNWRNNKNRAAHEGSYRLKEIGLEKMLDNEMSKACSEIDAIRGRKNGSDAHIAGTERLSGKKVDKKKVSAVESVKISESEGVNLKKVEKEMVLAVESVRMGETVYDKNGRKSYGNRRNNKIHGGREGCYRWKELELKKKSDSEKSEVCSVVSGISDLSRDDNVSEEPIVLAAESMRIVENRYMRRGNNNVRRFGDRRRHMGPGRFDSGRERKEREMIGMMWVKKEDESER